jgi:hypothetical protein
VTVGTWTSLGAHRADALVEAIGMATERMEHTHKEFAEALGEIMRAKYGDRLGNFDLRPVLSQVEGYSYEALRLMLKGERSLKMEAIEGISKVIGVNPHYFMEYRRMWSESMGRKYPELADTLYDVSLRFVELKEKTVSTNGASAPNDRRSGQSG